MTIRILSLVFAAALAAPAVALAQPFPYTALKVVVPFPAGRPTRCP